MGERVHPDGGGDGHGQGDGRIGVEYTDVGNHVRAAHSRFTSGCCP